MFIYTCNQYIIAAIFSISAVVTLHLPPPSLPPLSLSSLPLSPPSLSLSLSLSPSPYLSLSLSPSPSLPLPLPLLPSPSCSSSISTGSCIQCGAPFLLFSVLLDSCRQQDYCGRDIKDTHTNFKLCTHSILVYYDVFMTKYNYIII